MTLSPDRMFQKVRVRCLLYPESNETTSWGHPNFRAGKKTFVTFERWEGRPSIAFRVHDSNAAKSLVNKEGFFVTPYGRGKWISIWIDKEPPEWRLIEEWIDRSFKLVANKRMLLAVGDLKRNLPRKQIQTGEKR